MLKPKKKDAPILAAISYFLGIIPSLLIYLLEKEDRWVRYHALQSIIVDLAAGAVFFVVYIFVIAITFATFGIGAVCILGIFLLVPIYLLLKLIWAYKALQGESFDIPYIGAFVEKYV